MGMGLNVLELCAGGGGQALGLEQANWKAAALVELDPLACETLRKNRPHWTVLQEDLRQVSGKRFKGVDLIAAGVPCPPFSVAGKQLGSEDERDLFPEVIRMVKQIKPRAVMIENVRGLMDSRFNDYRAEIINALEEMQFRVSWGLLNAVDFDVPQNRARSILVAIKRNEGSFSWPMPNIMRSVSVGEAVADLMAERGWKNVADWKRKANAPGPTIVGGSKKHGGPDLGPTRAKQAWKQLGIDGMGIADTAPDVGFSGNPRLTLRMVARLQGFPDTWTFAGRKTASYRQIGNAFPPQIAKAVASQIAKALLNGKRKVS